MVEPRFRFLVALAAVMTVAAALVCAAQNLPLLDPDDDATGPAYVRFPLILLAAFCVDVLPRIAHRWWGKRADSGTSSGTSRRTSRLADLRATAVAVLHERWTSRQVRFTLVGLIAWYVTYAAFRNLKNAVPFVNGRLWDGTFERLDHTLFLGHDPADVLHSVFGTTWAAPFFSFVYVTWIVLIPVSLAWALVFSRRRAAATWFVTALGVDWALGAAAYFAFPTLGPVYSDPATFAGLPDTMVTGLQSSMIHVRQDVLAGPVQAHTLQSIAAFASLHVGLMFTICLIVHLAGARLVYRVAAWNFLALTSLSTIYLGWHFALDTLGGVVVGGAAVWIAALGTGNHVGWRPRLVLDPDETPAAAPADTRTPVSARH